MQILDIHTEFPLSQGFSCYLATKKRSGRYDTNYASHYVLNYNYIIFVAIHSLQAYAQLVSVPCQSLQGPA